MPVAIKQFEIGASQLPWSEATTASMLISDDELDRFQNGSDGVMCWKRQVQCYQIPSIA
jgi:hypothetical protein